MSGRDERFKEAMKKGHSAAWDQEWDRAASFYNQALEDKPGDPQALINMGLSLFELQEYSQSLKYYLKAVKASPGDPIPVEKVAELYELLGNGDRAVSASLQAAELYIKSRDVNKAIQNWKRAAGIQPGNMKARSRLALVNERLGRKPEAVQAYLDLASLFQQANDIEKAVKSVNRALQIMPGSREAHEALALLKESKMLPTPKSRREHKPRRLSQVGQLKAPKKIEESEPRRDPIEEAHKNALSVLAGLLFEIPSDEETSTISSRGLQAIMSGERGRTSSRSGRSKISLHLSQVVDLQSREQYGQAAEELQRAVDAGLEHPSAQFELGYLRAQEGRSESAVRSLKRAVNNPDFALGARLLTGKLLREMHRYQEAAIELMEALRLADVQMVPGQHAREMAYQYDPLIEAQRQETDVKEHRQLCANISNLLLRHDWQDQIRRAREQLPGQSNGGSPLPLAEILTQSSGSEIVETLTSIYQLAREGNLRSSMEEAFFALEYAPTYLPLHVYMGELLLKQDQLNLAINKFISVARVYSVRGEAHRSLDLYRRVVDLSPMDPEPREKLIDQLVNMGRYDEALEEYIDFAEMYYSLADLEMARETYSQALRLTRKAESASDWQANILNRIADIDMQSLDWREALKMYEKVRNIKPDDDRARRNIIDLNFRLFQEVPAIAEMDNYISYLLNKDQQGKALEFMEEVVEDNPDKAAVHRRMAALYRRLGRTSEAVAQLDAAGEALMEAGDRQGAIKIVEEILNLNPSNRGEYQQLLKQLKES